MVSGGIGKNELSTKDTSPISQRAWGLPAAAMHQSYARLNMARLNIGDGRQCPSRQFPTPAAAAVPLKRRRLGTIRKPMESLASPDTSAECPRCRKRAAL